MVLVADGAALERWWAVGWAGGECCGTSPSSAYARPIGVWLRDVPVASPPMAWMGDTIRVREAWVEHEYGDDVHFWPECPRTDA